MSFVYFLLHRDGALVKIGKADSILNRATSLGIKELDLKKSFGFKLASNNNAFKLEKTLHFLFDSYRIHPDLIKEKVNHSDGLTEWFNVACLLRLPSLIDSFGGLFPLERVEVEQSLYDVVDPVSGETKSEKRIRTRKERIEKRIELAVSGNREKFEGFCRVFSVAVNRVTFTGVNVTSPNCFDVFVEWPSDRCKDISGVDFVFDRTISDLIYYSNYEYEGWECGGYLLFGGGGLIRSASGVLNENVYRTYFTVDHPFLFSDDDVEAKWVEGRYKDALALFRSLPEQSDLSLYNRD